MEVNVDELVESFVSSFIEQCRQQIIPRNVVEQELDVGEPFYNISFPKEDLYGLIRTNALIFYYLCRGRDIGNNDYEFIHALVKIDPKHDKSILEAYKQPKHVYKRIKAERRLNKFINFLQDDFGRRSDVIHYDHVVPKKYKDLKPN